MAAAAVESSSFSTPTGWRKKSSFKIQDPAQLDTWSVVCLCVEAQLVDFVRHDRAKRVDSLGKSSEREEEEEDLE